MVHISGTRVHFTVDSARNLRILARTMKFSSRQLGLPTAATGRRHSYANVQDNGGARLRAISADAAYIRCDWIATNSGEPMT